MKYNPAENADLFVPADNPPIINSANVKIISSKNSAKSLPIISSIILILIIGGCIFADFIINHNPFIFYVQNLNQPPGSEFYFGTDSLGRDIFSIIWYGGRISLIIGIIGTVIISVVGIVYGCISGLSPRIIDSLLMRFAELLSSIPSILLLIFLISITNTPDVISMSVCIGLVNWMPLARMVRSEVVHIKNTEYFLAGQLQGASFFRLLFKYLMPNFWSTVMFMIISSISTCIMNEAVLSFLGLGFPVEVVSWGSMLSLANKALLTNSWWVIVFPGVFIVLTLFCVTNIGQYFKTATNHKYSNL